MQIEQQGSQKPNFFLVGLMAAAAVILLIVGAFAIVGWRSQKANKAPYTKHPVSMLRSGESPVLLD